jgi:AcrR family transcriptional regulator
LYLAKNEGWKDTTIRRICQKADVSIGSFYHHFKSKQEVVDKSFMAFDNTLLTDCADCQNPVEEVKNTIMKQAKYIVDEAGMVTAEYYAALLQGGDSAAASPSRIYYKKLKKHMEDAKTQGFIKDEYEAEYAAEFLIKFNRGAIVDWCLSGYNYDVLERLEKELDLILSIFIK